jgi:hypothetical protein
VIRSVLVSVALLAALAAPSLAGATEGAGAAEGAGGDTPAFGENPARHYESSQRFSLELKFGPYSPDIDASSGTTGLGGHPFADLFPPAAGKSRPPGRLLTQGEFDYQFLHRWWGNLGVGITAGFYRRTAHSLSYIYPLAMPPVPCDSSPKSTTPCSGAVGDTTALNIIPLSLLFVYKFDYLAKRYKIPFVPYVKAGLAYYAWWIENGGGFLSIAQYQNATTGEKDSGFGGTWGYVLNPGGAFLLDVIDPTAARTLDAELGINHCITPTSAAPARPTR